MSETLEQNKQTAKALPRQGSAEADTLVLRVEGNDARAVSGLEDIVTRHLHGFVPVGESVAVTRTAG